MRSLSQRFRRGWMSGGQETLCGSGSTVASTSRLRRWLPELLNSYPIATINDAGCGDLNWISTLDLSGFDYLGIDVVEHQRWADIASPGIRFQVADICSVLLRPADLTICRDVLIHLPNEMVLQAVNNLSMTSKYLLATSFEGASNLRRKIVPGEFAKLDLEARPFKLGPPILKLREKFRGKYLGFWSTDQRELS